MLVVKVESAYFKKATGRTRFVCEDGDPDQKSDRRNNSNR